MIQIGDNEPDCFNPVHRDVHPVMFGFDELWESTVQFGSLLRRLYPGVHINGPSWRSLSLCFTKRQQLFNASLCLRC